MQPCNTIHIHCTPRFFLRKTAVSLKIAKLYMFLSVCCVSFRCKLFDSMMFGVVITLCTIIVNKTLILIFVWVFTLYQQIYNCKYCIPRYIYKISLVKYLYESISADKLMLSELAIAFTESWSMFVSVNLIHTEQ